MTNPVLSRAERKAQHRAALRDALPHAEALASGLRTVFDAVTDGDVAIENRTVNKYASSFPSEIVRCRASDGRELTVLCKYGAGRDHASYGHRGNVAYEAAVYRRVLHPLGSSAPAWFGSFVVADTGDCCLVVEYIDDAVRVEHTADGPSTLPNVARWIAGFHAGNESRAADPSLAFLARHDVEYCRQWARRAAQLTVSVRDAFPWLSTACQRFERAADALLAAPTIIHGEYTPKNILMQGTRVCPVDWESAAVAPGEIDLAGLIDGRWPEALVDESTRAYAQARWPAGAPAAFAARLDLARMYWNFRWLGERPDWATSERGLRRIENVRQLAERLELL